MNVLITAIIIVLLFYILYYIRTTPTQNGIAGYFVRQSRKKQESKGKIIEYLQKHEQITNKEARDILRVSERTVVRYMDELEKQGVIEQVGDIGQGVFYSLKNTPK